MQVRRRGPSPAIRELAALPAIAQKVAAGANEDIGKAILAVYRSAAHPVMRSR
jgi:hypothetical protein